MTLRTENESVLTIARPVLVVADRHMTVAELSTLLVEHRLSSAAVTDHGKLVGLAYGTPHGGAISLSRQRDALVRDVMTPLRTTLLESATIVEAAAKMAAHDVPGLVVVCPRGTALAAVSARDILAWYAQRHGLIQRDPHAMWCMADGRLA